MKIIEKPNPDSIIRCSLDEIKSYQLRSDGLWLKDQENIHWWLLEGKWIKVLPKQQKTGILLNSR